ncbi:MAG: translation initiation factor IF-2, partial [Deltaproteobacteria bacterium]|nr:translation initiation factor IF-2 [Deltaproteobacteria bacterium]
MSTIEEAEVQVVKRAIDRERQDPVQEKVLRAGVLLRKGVNKPKPPAPEEEVPAAAPVAAAMLSDAAATMAAAPAAESGWQADPVVGEPTPALAEAAPSAISVQDTTADVPQPGLVKPEAQVVVAPPAADAAGDAAGEGMPRIVGRIELPKPLAKVVGKAVPKTTAESEAAKLRLSQRKGDARRPARRIEEMRASAVPAWDARAKRPRKKKVAPGTKTRKTEITTPKAIKRVVRIEGQISLQELAKAMEVKATEVLMRLIKMGMTTVHINSSLDVDTAKIVAAEFTYEEEDVSFEEDGLSQTVATGAEVEGEIELSSRAPVVTVMGHVDHGKTSLLDHIRKTRVAKGEAGGITQTIGASEVKTKKGRVVFIDTPGHEAFTEMRARGAQVTDLIVLVVAANDGVQAQTIESINHAKAAEVPIVVAVNKMDLPNANLERARKELADVGLLGEDWGGDTLFAEVSAETGQGIDRLLENILLQSEMLDLQCNPDRLAHGSVIEARLDKGKGPVASVLVTDGTLRVGDNIVAGAAFGRVRAMTNHLGKPVQVAEPSTAVEVLGLNNVPLASDPVDAVSELKKAQLVAESRAGKLAAAGAAEGGGTALTDILLKIQAGEKAELKVILKSDVQGSLEAVKAAILKLGTEKVGTSVIHASVGGITESDVNLGSASGAL